MKITKAIGKVLYEDQSDNIKATLEAALKARVYLGSADLAGANLGGADLVGANLADADLEGANLTGADLEDANLGCANLGGANLRCANLEGANLGSANLGGANLAGANLARATLAGANLDGAYLARANLARANLARATLAGANLVGATLAGAKLSATTNLTGEPWKDYLEKVVPALCTAGGKSLEQVAAVWDCHEWENCPMHVAFDASGPESCPPLLRGRFDQFVRLFDARLIPNPLGDKASSCPATT